MKEIPFLPNLDGEQPEKPEEQTIPDSPAAIALDLPAQAGSRRVETAESMAKKQRQISVSEFFSKNRHLLGFDNPKRALLTAVKEAVDNSLDACEEAGFLPDVEVRIEDQGQDRFMISVRDNGPGIVKAQVPNVFGKLLYGSKFHRLKMSRGQQGIGISAAGMYGLITTGRPIEVISRTSEKRPACKVELRIDTKKNRPEIVLEEELDWDSPHGTKVTIYLEGKFHRGRQSVEEYLKQTAIANPHVTMTYFAPDGQQLQFPRATTELPPQTAEIKPHPKGVELGVLQAMLHDSSARTMDVFLTQEFSRVSARVAEEICVAAGISPKAWTTRIGRDKVEDLLKGIQNTKIMNPPTSCVAPIGETQLLSGLSSVVPADFYAASTRPPAVYRGNPFIIEAAIAYGGEQVADQQARILRFANRVPLLYQQGACCSCEAVNGVNWKAYKLLQPRGSLPVAPLTVVVHMASVWVPFTSESKEAIACYPEIEEEMIKALQDCGRKLRIYLSHQHRSQEQEKKHKYIASYIPHIAIGLRDLLGFGAAREQDIQKELTVILERARD